MSVYVINRGGHYNQDWYQGKWKAIIFKVWNCMLGTIGQELLSQLTACLFLWLAGCLLNCNMSEHITSQLCYFICQSKLSVFVWKWVGEGKIGLFLRMSIQDLPYLKSLPNLVIIAWWGTHISSMLMLLFPFDLASSQSPLQQ